MTRLLRTGLVATLILLTGAAVAYAGSSAKAPAQTADAGRASREAIRALIAEFPGSFGS